MNLYVHGNGAAHLLLAACVVLITSNSERAVAGPPGCLADYNNDGACVDARDFVLYRKYFETNHPLPNDNGLGTPIRTAHYTLWRANFGNTLGSGTELLHA